MSNFHFCQFGPEHTEAEGNAEMTWGNETSFKVVDVLAQI